MAIYFILGNLLYENNKRHLRQVRESMHFRLENSFARHKKCQSMLDIQEEENNKLKEEKKFQQFHDFYFFFENQKKIRKQASLQRVEKLEKNHKLKNEKLKDMKTKNVLTMKKIEQTVKNKMKAQEKMNDYLEVKRIEHERRNKEVEKYRKEYDNDREIKNIDTLCKQMDFINQKQRIDEANHLNSQHQK